MTDLTARLEAAALSLAGPGPIKDRFTVAYAHLEDLQASELPELGPEFAEMIKVLHRERALPGDDVVRASVRKLSNEDVRQYAELLVRLYGMVAGIKHQRAARSAAVRSGSTSALPSVASLSSAVTSLPGPSPMYLAAGNGAGS